MKVRRNVFSIVLFYGLFSFISFCFADDKIEWIDYCAKINQAVKPPGVPDSGNAHPLLQQAAALYVEPNGIARKIWDEYYHTGKVIPYNDLTEYQRKGLSKWYYANQPAWEKIVEASEKDYYWQIYKYYENIDTNRCFKDTIDVPLGYLSGLNNINHMCEFMTREYVAQSNYRKAVDVYAAIIKVGCVIRHARVSLSEQLIGEAYMLVGYEKLLDILDDASLTKDDIQYIKISLAELKASIRPAVYSGVEDMFTRSLIQNMFSIDRVVHKTIPYANLEKYHDGFDMLFSFYGKKAPDWKVVAKEHANYYEVMRILKKLEETNSKLAYLTPYQRSRHNLEDIISEDEITKYYVCRGHSAFLYESGSVLLWRSRLYLEAVIVVVALKHWQFDKGFFPQTLDELVTAGYLRQIPEDLYSDGKIKYKKKGKSFLLYSNGFNMKDDGGSREMDEESQEKDLVFWPVAHKDTSTQ
jgi:hypothetical protein